MSATSLFARLFGVVASGWVALAVARIVGGDFAVTLGLGVFGFGTALIIALTEPRRG